MRHYLDFILDFIFPSKCILCGRYGLGYVCPECFSKFKIPDKYCKFCGRPLTGISEICYNCNKENPIWDGFEFLGYYDDMWETIIKNLKFRNKPNVAKFIADLAKDKILNKKWDIDFITYVPLSSKRIVERGYNQSEYLAYFLSKSLKKPYGPLLSLNKDIKPQKTLSLKERKENVKGAFSLKEEVKDLHYRNILIVDDVYTTGSTLRECVYTLKNNIKFLDKIYIFVAVRALL